nr:hypothetical protein [Tanacetum cinerariifolium]
MNKIKKVTFTKPITSSSTNQETHNSNKPMLHSTGVKCSISASGSKPSSNTKYNRISQPSSSNKIIKVEDQPRSVKTRKNNKNCVKKVKCDDHVMQSISNVNFASVSINNTPVKNSVNDVKSGCLCAICVPPKQPTSYSDAIQKLEIKVYCMKPKNVRHIGSSKVAKIVESKNAYHSKPNHTWGSIAIDIPSSSSLVMIGFPDCSLIARIMGYGDYQLGNVVISRPEAASINEKRYILVIVDDYSRFTWNVRTDNETEFINQTLREFYENVGISHQTSVARTPQYNGVVERLNQTLVEATRTMLIFSKASLFLWAAAISTAFYTQNRSLIRHRYNKTPYELMQHKKPDLSFVHVFRSLCYPINDHEDLGKFDAKADIVIFVGYAPAKKAFRIYNRRNQIIFKTIHVTFDELTAMASKQLNRIHVMTPATPTDTPRAEVLADSPVSISISQDAPSTRFVDQDNPSHVYKLKKALYGLKQAPRAWYDMLSSFLISQQFSKGVVDLTLFTRQARNDLLLDTRRSTSGSTQFLGDKLVSWSSKKQNSTAISNYGFQFNKIPLYCNNKSAIALCCNNVQHSRDKHIDVRYHFIKEQVENGIMELYFVRTEYHWLTSLQNLCLERDLTS